MEQLLAALMLPGEQSIAHLEFQPLRLALTLRVERAQPLIERHHLARRLLGLRPGVAPRHPLGQELWPAWIGVEADGKPLARGIGLARWIIHSLQNRSEERRVGKECRS